MKKKNLKTELKLTEISNRTLRNELADARKEIAGLHDLFEPVFVEGYGHGYDDGGVIQAGIRRPIRPVKELWEQSPLRKAIGPKPATTMIEILNQEVSLWEKFSTRPTFPVRAKSETPEAP